VLREKEPKDDLAISHGICDDHVLVVLTEARRSNFERALGRSSSPAAAAPGSPLARIR